MMITASFEILLDALMEWKTKNTRLPDKILIYRDGVSEGQIQHVHSYEIDQLRTVIKRVYEDQEVQFAFTIVTKRVNARFFAQQSRGYENPPPGTIIDTVVTRRERYDFFLISQAVRQGTVNPTMYNIIADNTGWKAQHHQQLAYKMCHLYYNWAVRIAQKKYFHLLKKLSSSLLFD